MASDITVSEWQAEMERLWQDRPQDEGMTIDEWVEVLKGGRASVQGFIRGEVRAGRMLRGQRYIAKDWDGRARTYQVYRPKETTHGAS